MSEAQAEHRGWEIESSYKKHYLDDPYYDVVEDDGEGTSPAIWVAGIVTVALCVGVYLLGQYLEPPKVVFPVPPAPQVLTNFSVPVYFPALPPGWTAQCIVGDMKTLILHPAPGCCRLSQ